MNRLPVACSTASISDNDPCQMTMKCIRKVMLNVCELIPYKKTGKLGSSSKLEKYQYCQMVQKYECTYPGCKREYAIFQRDGFICVYHYAFHVHEPQVFRLGINPLIKKKLLERRFDASPAALVFNELLDLNLSRDPCNIAQRDLLLHGVTLDDRFRQKLSTAWKHLKLQNDVWFPDEAYRDVFTGTNMDQVGVFMESNRMTLESFAKTSVEELKAMSPDQLQRLVVIDTDIGKHEDHSYTFLNVTCFAILFIIDAAILRSHQTKCGVQYEADYAYNIMNFYQVGVIGVSDFARRFHALLWDINLTENSVGAGRIFNTIKVIFKIRGHKEHIDIFSNIVNKDKMMSDGSAALKKAIETIVDLIHHLCLSHMIRSGISITGKGHGR